MKSYGDSAKKKPSLAVVFSSGKSDKSKDDPNPREDASGKAEETGGSDLHKDPDIRQACAEYWKAMGAEPDDEDAACESLVGLIELVAAKAEEGEDPSY